jgi:hypothetical protein
MKLTNPTLAIHSTHEAAARIAGIGAVFDGILPEPRYQSAFAATLLVGPALMPIAKAPLASVYFDSAVTSQPSADWAKALAATSFKYGARIVFGSRKVGGVETDVLLCCPDGAFRSEIDAFAKFVNDEFGFDLLKFEEGYPAITYEPDGSLDRLLTCYRDPAASIPEAQGPEQALYNHRGGLLHGGASFVRESDQRDRARFPDILALDSFADFPRANHYLIELQFYCFAAAPLWAAANALIELKYRPSAVTLFAHDWVGVPLFWAMRRDGAGGRPVTSAYFAHEARVCRLLAEGLIKDQRDLLARYAHPDGHDVAFYGRLAQVEHMGDSVSQGFAGNETAFDFLYHHALNSQAAKFDHLIAVGPHVARETALILRGKGGPPVRVSVCPNGVPNRLAQAAPGASEGQLETAQADARERILEFAEANFQFRPNYLFTSVNRCEMSKAPWRSVEFFRAFMEAPINLKKTGLFIWLTRPKPLPSAKEMAEWRQWGWPVLHRPRSSGGDLRIEEQKLWELIDDLNSASSGRYRVLYINQYGWGADILGSLNVVKTSFDDLRNGTDVEVGLAIYEPYGIAPLEPFSSGAVCALSDASGCAAHLDALFRKGLISADGFVIGNFSRSSVDPREIDLRELRNVERKVYNEMIVQLDRKLAIPRRERIGSAQAAMTHLSWSAAAQQLLNDVPELSSQTGTPPR